MSPALYYRDPADGNWKPLITGGGVTDHGALTGLADDDHPQYVKKAGDQMTGNLEVGDGTKVDLITRMRSAAGSSAGVVFATGAQAFGALGGERWKITKTADPETGSDGGSDFAIFRYNDAGSYIDTALKILRTTGEMILRGSLTVDGIGKAGFVTIQSDTSYAELRISAPAGQTPGVLMKRSGNTRWKYTLDSSNDDLLWGRYDASGGYLNTPVRMRQSDGRLQLTAGDPVNALDAATKQYVDAQDGGQLILASGWSQLAGYTNRVTYHGGMFTLEAMIAPTSTKTLTAGTLTQVCTLPADTWPVGLRTTGTAAYSLTSGAVATGRLDVNTNGAVSFSPTVSGSMTTSGWVGINITYREG